MAPPLPWLASLAFLAVHGSVTTAANSTHNVIMIAVDDLRPMFSDLEPDRFGFMKTPNMNAFMKDALALRQSHVQQAVCSPSRTSLLTGRRPDTTHVYDLQTYFRDAGCADCKTIPEIFKDAGYKTFGMGKIFHPGTACGGYTYDVDSFTEPYFDGEDAYTDNDYSWMSINSSAEAAVPLQDQQILYHALEVLKNVSALGAEERWFMAVGFHKPHLPLIAPERFFDIYPSDTIELASNPYAPADMPDVAYASWELQNWGDVAAVNFTGQVNETLVDWKAIEERRAYQAAVSFMDENVGLLLQEVQTLGLWESTVIVFWGDHGFKLGEHGAWCKHTNWDIDTTSPVLLRLPGVTDGGIISEALVEHVDLMPTIAEAAGITVPPTCPETEPWLTAHCTEGTSFLALAKKPSLAWKNASYSQYPRSGDIMGYSMTTEAHVRFTAWVDFNTTTNTTAWTMTSSECGLELYDHVSDPDENYNLAYRSDYADEVDSLFVALKAGWRSTLDGLTSFAIA